MLLSGIGEPYDPVSPERPHRQELLLPDRRQCAAVLRGQVLPSVHGRGWLERDHRRLQHQLGLRPRPHMDSSAPTMSSSSFNTALPIGYRPVPAGTPQWGKAWKAATAKWYQKAMNINASGSVLANRNNYYDLDPTYRNAFGQPLMRMTFDYKENEHKLGRHSADLVNAIARSMNAASVIPASARVEPWTVVPISRRTIPAAPSWAPTRGTARSTNICRAGIVTISSWSGRMCSRTIRPTTRPARWARSPIGPRTIKALRQEPWPHGAGMMNTAKLICTIVLTCSASLARQGDAARRRSSGLRLLPSLTAGENGVGPSLAGVIGRKGGNARRLSLLAGAQAQQHRLVAADARDLHRRSAEGGAR